MKLKNCFSITLQMSKLWYLSIYCDKDILNLSNDTFFQKTFEKLHFLSLMAFLPTLR